MGENFRLARQSRIIFLLSYTGKILTITISIGVIVTAVLGGPFLLGI